MQVVTCVDPHKASHTAVAIGKAEDEISTVRGAGHPAPGATALGLGRTLRGARLGHRVGRWEDDLLAQQLIARGEQVLDVPPTLASRIRVLATGRPDKNDPKDALSVAVAAFRAPNVRSVDSADRGEVLRLLAKRDGDLGGHRTRVVYRLHVLLAQLAAGGIAAFTRGSDLQRRVSAAASRPR